LLQSVTVVTVGVHASAAMAAAFSLVVGARHAADRSPIQFHVLWWESSST
jgi:hypothetical protein